MSEFLTKLLNYYSLSSEDLARRNSAGSFSRITLPDGLPEFENVIKRLEQAIRSQERTVIYGDYDVDGLTSAAILYSALLKRGLKCGYFIPSRYKEGYGLCASRVEEFHEKGYHLIITVDNGVSCQNEVSLARKLGMEVIIIDHHECPIVLPDTPYFFHQNHSGFLDYNCSAASLAYFVARRLLSEHVPYLATLAGIAVFSDVMPLIKNNLEFAKLSLSFLNQYRYPNLLPLLVDQNISYDSINFHLIPALNSPGRIATDSLLTNRACQLLLTKNPSLIQTISDSLLEMNEKRKRIVKDTVFEKKDIFETSHSLTVLSSQYVGLGGLFANKLMREKNKPTLVFSIDSKDEEHLVGSLRLPEGYHSDPFLKKDLFLVKGGHDKAAGMTILKSSFYKVLTVFASEYEKQSLHLVSQEKVIPLDLNDLCYENYRIYEMFFPFGEGFPSPLFSVSFSKEDVTFSKNGNAAFVYAPNQEGKVLIFSQVDELRNPLYSFYTVIGKMSKNTFQNKDSIVLAEEKLISEQ